MMTWGGKRESNPQPPEPQSGALPVELFPPQETNYSNCGGMTHLPTSSELQVRSSLARSGAEDICFEAKNLLREDLGHKRRSGI